MAVLAANRMNPSDMVGMVFNASEVGTILPYDPSRAFLCALELGACAKNLPSSRSEIYPMCSENQAYLA